MIAKWLHNGTQVCKGDEHHEDEVHLLVENGTVFFKGYYVHCRFFPIDVADWKFMLQPPVALII